MKDYGFLRTKRLTPPGHVRGVEEAGEEKMVVATSNLSRPWGRLLKKKQDMSIRVLLDSPVPLMVHQGLSENRVYSQWNNHFS